MNLIIIGSRNPDKLAKIIYSTFDDCVIAGYTDINSFMEAASVRSMVIHRMLLLQDGLDSDKITDEEINIFVDYLQRNYPTARIVTISKDIDMNRYLCELFPGSNNAHFCVPNTVSGKMLTDFAYMEVDKLKNVYSNFCNKDVQVGNATLIDEIPDDFGEQYESNSEVPGYISRTSAPPPKKRGFLSKVIGFGEAPQKEEGRLVNNSLKRDIGQGLGVDEFSQEAERVDFDAPQGNSDNDDDIDYSFFGSDDNDLGGIEVNSEEVQQINNRPRVNLEKEDIEEENNSFGYNDSDYENSDYNNSGYDDYNNEYNNDYANEDNSDYNEEESYGGGLSLEKSDSFEDDMQSQDDNSMYNNSLDELKRSLEETDLSLNLRGRSNNVMLEDAADVNSNIFGNMGNLMDAYERSNIKIIQKEVLVPSGGSSGESSFRNKNGVKILIVTGDRRIGVTKLALNLAGVFARREKVLYADFDRIRHGSLGYLDFESILDEEEHIQNGLNHLKSLNILPNVLHTYKKGGFYSLLSMYGTSVSDEQMLLAQELLSRQKKFNTIVIDCPIENIYLLKNIIYNGHVLLCAEDDKVGLLNLITMLNVCSGDENMLTTIFEKSFYVVGRRGNLSKFQSALSEVNDLFESESYNWGNIEILGTIKGTKELIERLGD